MVNVDLPQQARGGVAIVDAQLAARTVAIGVDRGLGHAELAADLLGRQVLVDQAQTLPLPGGQQADRAGDDVHARSHNR